MNPYADALTAEKCRDDALTSDFNERWAKRDGEERGRETRKAILNLADNLYLSADDCQSVIDRVIDEITDHHPAGGIDAQAYWAAVKGEE